ncbi:MAG: hypothetical protein WBG35_12085 [Acidobacteriaceae bacterium]
MGGGIGTGCGCDCGLDCAGAQQAKAAEQTMTKQVERIMASSVIVGRVGVSTATGVRAELRGWQIRMGIATESVNRITCIGWNFNACLEPAYRRIF